MSPQDSSHPAGGLPRLMLPPVPRPHPEAACGLLLEGGLLSPHPHLCCSEPTPSTHQPSDGLRVKSKAGATHKKQQEQGVRGKKAAWEPGVLGPSSSRTTAPPPRLCDRGQARALLLRLFL